jgi:hypothetical protein
MSKREMLKRAIDYMSDDFISVIYTMYGDEMDKLEIPNEDTIQAYEDCKNGKVYTYTTFEDLLNSARELDDDDE